MEIIICFHNVRDYVLTVIREELINYHFDMERYYSMAFLDTTVMDFPATVKKKFLYVRYPSIE